MNQGELVTTTSKIKLNQTAGFHGSYTLDIEIDLPVHNKNYFPATISGGKFYMYFTIIVSNLINRDRSILI